MNGLNGKEGIEQVDKVSENSIQDLVFQKIKEKIGPDQDFSQQLSDVLGISIHSVYRRLRKDVPLTLSELEKLIEHFKLNFFEFVTETTNNFHSTYLMEGILDYRTTLNKYEGYLESFKQMGTRHISYYGIDIMPFMLMSSPVILAFQEYFWNVTQGNKNQTANSLLSFDNVSVELVDHAYYFQHFIQSVPTCEIWSVLCFDALISQIEYLKDTHRFASEKDYELMCNEVKKMVDWGEMQANCGYKTDMSGKVLETKIQIKMYVSDWFFSESNFLVQTNQQDLAIIKHNFISYIFTNNSNFVELNRKTIKNLIYKSQPIAGTNEKARIAFFGQLRKRVNLKLASPA